MPKPLVSDSQSGLRTHLLDLLGGGNAHADFDSTIKDFPVDQRGKKPSGAPHTAWQLLEHLRLAQLDILEFSRDARHKSPAFPDGYWPDSEAPPSDSAWDTSVAHFHRDAKAFSGLIADPKNDLLAPLSHAPEHQTLLREALVLADHNSYHAGQIVLLRRLLGAWK
jgi:hypothetical protein